MDNSASWAPRPALVAVGLVGALAALAGAFFYDARTGEVLFFVAAVLLTVLSAHGLLVRPRLAADADGVRIRTIRGERRFTWSEVNLSVRGTKRLGRESRTLEITAGDHLFIFGWLELGADPVDVLDVLSALRP